MLAEFFNAVTALAAAVVAICALLGLSSWKQQRRTELRDRVLVNFYRIQGILEEARHPFGAGPQLPEHQTHTNVYNHAAKTLALHEREISEWRASRYSAKISFKNIENSYDGFEKIITRVRVASVLLTLHHATMSEEDKRENERILYIRSENDEVQATIKQLLRQLEKVVSVKS